MAQDNRTAAYELFATSRWRSCASRAYYAIYSDATRCLLQAGVVMPAVRDNPSHHTLPILVANNLTILRPQARARLSGFVYQLYSFRIVSDYIPALDMIEDDARVCIRLMTMAFEKLKAIP